MITKVTYYRELPKDGEEVHVLEFPELEFIDTSDPDIQKVIIRYGLAVGFPGGELLFKKNVRLDALGGKE